MLPPGKTASRRASHGRGRRQTARLQRSAACTTPTWLRHCDEQILLKREFETRCTTSWFLPGHGGAASRVCTEGISDPGLASSALAITKQARGRNLREFTARWRTAVEPTSRLEPTSRPQLNGRSTMNGRPTSATTTTTDEELLGVVPSAMRLPRSSV